jgi:hypothetical protein
MAGLAFLMGHTPPSVPVTPQPAASAEVLSQAWALAENAQTLAARHPEKALPQYRQAYELSQDPLLLLEIARLERDVGHAARATHALELFLDRGAGRVSEQRMSLAARQWQAVAADTARLTVHTNVLGASLELEAERGVALASGFLVNVLVDAGERRISLSKPGFETRTLLLNLEKGEVRALRIDLDKPAGSRSETGSGRPRWTRLYRCVVLAQHRQCALQSAHST